MPHMHVISHGIDLVEVARIARMLDEHGDRFIARCFTDGERGYAESVARRRAERYAVRFAAKEAVFKALGTGWRSGISWRDVEVVRGPAGEPSIRLSGRCSTLAAAMGVHRWLVSLTHVSSHAAASVIAAGPVGPVASAHGCQEDPAGPL